MAIQKIREDAKPLYLLAKEQLMQLLDDCDVGARLPSEEVLSKELGISRNTLREAIKVMAQKGFVQQRQGSGTFVVKKPRVIRSGLEKLESLDATAKRNGWVCATENVRIESVSADKDLSKRLQLELGARLTEVSRVKVINGQKVAFMTDLIPHSVLPPERIQADFKGSVLELLLADGNVDVDYAYTELQPAQADKYLSKLLDVAEGTPLMLSLEMVHGVDGKPLEYALNYLVSDLFHFHIIRRIGQDDGGRA